MSSASSLYSMEIENSGLNNYRGGNPKLVVFESNLANKPFYSIVESIPDSSIFSILEERQIG